MCRYIDSRPPSRLCTLVHTYLVVFVIHVFHTLCWLTMQLLQPYTFQLLYSLAATITGLHSAKSREIAQLAS